MLSGAKLPASNGGGYGEGVRRQVFEVIARQAMVGAPWQEICAGPMMVNSITVEQVEEELRRRRGGDQPPDAAVPQNPESPQGTGSVALSLPAPPPSASEELFSHRQFLLQLVNEKDQNEIRATIEKAAAQLDNLIARVRLLEVEINSKHNELFLQSDLTRELNRTTQPLKPGEDPGPHPIK